MQLAPVIRRRYSSWWRSLSEGPRGSFVPCSGDDLLVLLEHPRGLRMALERVQGPESALRLYLRLLDCVDEDCAGHRVFLEDFAETLLMPPTLIRELSQAHDRLLTDGVRVVSVMRLSGATASVSL